MAHSDAQKAEALAALAANGGNVARTARQIGVPATTLTKWSKGVNVNGDVTEKGEEKRIGLADRLETLAHQIVDRLPEKFDDATAQQLATTLGITVDKMQILRGKPSQINQETADPERRRERIAELLAKRNGANDDRGNRAPDAVGG